MVNGDFFYTLDALMTNKTQNKQLNALIWEIELNISQPASCSLLSLIKWGAEEQDQQKWIKCYPLLPTSFFFNIYIQAYIHQKAINVCYCRLFLDLLSSTVEALHVTNGTLTLTSKNFLPHGLLTKLNSLVKSDWMNLLELWPQLKFRMNLEMVYSIYCRSVVTQFCHFTWLFAFLPC